MPMLRIPMRGYEKHNNSIKKQRNWLRIPMRGYETRKIQKASNCQHKLRIPMRGYEGLSHRTDSLTLK